MNGLYVCTPTGGGGPANFKGGYNEIAATKAVVDAAGYLEAGAPRKPFRAIAKDRVERLRSTFQEKFPHFCEGN